MSRLNATLLVVTLLLGVAAAFLGLQHLADQSEWVIPRQVTFSETDEFHDERDHQVKDQWLTALDAFRRSASLDEAYARSYPLLRQIWMDWPKSEFAVLAQALAIETSSLLDHSADQENQLAVDYLARSLEIPRLYFSRRYEASSQAIDKRGLEVLIKQGETDQAKSACVRLRWEIPRVDKLVSVCSSIMNKKGAKFDTASALAKLSPQVGLYKVPKNSSEQRLGMAIKGYLLNPFEGGRMKSMLDELRKLPDPTVFDTLLKELAQLDHEAVWQLENASE